MKKKGKEETFGKRNHSKPWGYQGVLSPSGQFEHAIVVNIVVEKWRCEGRHTVHRIIRIPRVYGGPIPSLPFTR